MLFILLLLSNILCDSERSITNFTEYKEKCADSPPILVQPVVIKIYRYPKLPDSEKSSETRVAASNQSEADTLNILIMLQWKLLITMQLNLITITHQSIEGVTYQNHFDFEQRFSNVRECDPFYWHPLHLPEHCAEMFEELIRTQAAAQTPVRVYRKRARPNIYSFNTDYSDSVSNEDYWEEHFSRHSKPYRYHSYESNEPDYEPISPYQEMLKLLTRDVMKKPTAPVVEMVAPYGPVAMYKQQVSKQSKNLIEKIARAYANAGRSEDDVHVDTYYSKIDVRYTPGFEASNNGSVSKKISGNSKLKSKKKTQRL